MHHLIRIFIKVNPFKKTKNNISHHLISHKKKFNFSSQIMDVIFPKKNVWKISKDVWNLDGVLISHKF